MLKRIRRLPSPSLVISIIALVVAVGGGTYAIALNKHDTKKVVNKQIEKKAPKLSVRHAEKADKAKVAKPIGPAGGDLTGTYPDPLIGAGVVDTNNLADDSVTNSKLADEVSASKLGTPSRRSAPTSRSTGLGTEWRACSVPPELRF